MNKITQKLVEHNTTLFQEVIKEKIKEGKTPAVVIFISADNKIETFHREGTDANMLRMFLDKANEYAHKLEMGLGADQYYPENFKSK